jgi:hypothetical protein
MLASGYLVLIGVFFRLAWFVIALRLTSRLAIGPDLIWIWRHAWLLFAIWTAWLITGTGLLWRRRLTNLAKS